MSKTDDPTRAADDLPEQQLPSDTVAICGCGLPLVPSYDKNGKRTGVTHRDDYDMHHERYFAGLVVRRIAPAPSAQEEPTDGL